MSDEQTADPSTGKGNRTDLLGKSSRSRSLIHSVSIIVETVHDDRDALPVLAEEEGSEEKQSNDCRRASELSHDTEPEGGRLPLSRKERHQSSPIIFLDDHLPESKEEVSPDNQVVQSIFATARLRKEAFARLLEEHAQLVDEINRAETSFVS